jgi:hypothetical protein
MPRTSFTGVTLESDQVDHLEEALPSSSIRLVLGLLEQPDDMTPYTSLKRRLLSSRSRSAPVPAGGVGIQEAVGAS